MVANPTQPIVPPKGTYRCSFTLPQALAVDISTIAKALRMSQSALLTLLLTEPIEAIAKLVSLLPPGQLSGPVPDDVVRRLRGESIGVLRRAVSDAVQGAKDIDPGFTL
jgi:hypothetical protein